MKRREPVHFGKRYEVSAWIPPSRMADVAHTRVEGMVGYFLSCAHRDPVKWMDDLYILARSCYLQGATDTADVAAMMERGEVNAEGRQTGNPVREA
jgi:hypothetical protein